MKFTLSVLAAAMLCLLSVQGCYVEEEDEQVATSAQAPGQLPPVVDLYRDLAIQNAIISQHTIYPYHFVNNSATLNTLGQRDMAVLAAHLAQNPGQLSVRRGRTEGPLYQARVESVKARLAEGGVDNGRIRLGDGFAGGEGMDSSEIIDVLARSRDPLTHTGSDNQTSYSNSTPR
ncbi:MAG: hypothetical protein LLF76_04055 [Planctomycetaceae bacterium]|nr:hypothetical protein [Planctomycetaceae bacterium]